MVGPTFLTDLILSKIISWIILNHIILIVNIYIICSNYFPVTILVILSPWSSCCSGWEAMCSWALPSVHVIQVPRAGETVPTCTSCYISYYTCWMMLNDVAWCWYIVNLSILNPLDDFASFCHLWAKFQLISVVQASQWQRALTLFSAWHLV